MRHALPVAVLLLLVAGCASTAEGPSRDQRYISYEEIVDSGHFNALDLIRTVRPHWLRQRGAVSIYNEPEIVVYIDGVRIGAPPALSDIPTSQIEGVRYYDSREAQYRFGIGHAHGAIEVITRSS